MSSSSMNEAPRASRSCWARLMIAACGTPTGGGVIQHTAHPLFPELVQAYGVRTTYTDYDFNWDNTGKCADYASFRWSSS